MKITAISFYYNSWWNRFIFATNRQFPRGRVWGGGGLGLVAFEWRWKKCCVNKGSKDQRGAVVTFRPRFHNTKDDKMLGAKPWPPRRRPQRGENAYTWSRVRVTERQHTRDYLDCWKLSLRSPPNSQLTLVQALRRTTTTTTDFSSPSSPQQADAQRSKELLRSSVRPVSSSFISHIGHAHLTFHIINTYTHNDNFSESTQTDTPLTTNSLYF